MDSIEPFKQTWGEMPISLIAINLIAFLAALPFVALGIVLILAGSVVTIVTGIGVILAGGLFSFLLSQTLQGVVKTSLYVYATEGKTPAEFDNVDFGDLPADQDSGEPGGSRQPSGTR